MGKIMNYICHDCGYEEKVYSGSGMLNFDPEKQKELFNCPVCGCISLRTVKCKYDEEEGAYTPILVKRQKCRKCNSVMVWAESGGKLTCPQCHSNNCRYDMIGLWD